MTGIIGLDVEAVAALGGSLEAQGGKLESIVSSVDQLVASLPGIWRGHDADQFAGWWRDQHRPKLVAASQAIHGLGQSAKNNASEQVHVSGMSGAASAGGSLALAGSVVGVAVARAAAAGHAGGAVTPAAAGPAAASSTAVAKVAAFVASTPSGTKVGNGQCVMVFEKYNTQVVGAPFIGVGNDGGAKLFYERFDSLPGMSEHYDQIPVGGSPQVGDAVVWGGTPTNSYGHIAVITGVSGDGQFQVIEQNSPRVGDPVGEHTYTSTANVLGYLRPKNL